MEKLLNIFLGFITLVSFTSCQQDHGSAQEQFRERQEAILEREDADEAELDTVPYRVDPEDAPISISKDHSNEKPSSTATDKVVGIKDGDTIVLLKNGEEVTVRLYGIDTPEKKQPYGQKAKQFTSDLAFEKEVRLITHNKDRYGRTVGTIILPDGRNLNEELVKNGFAWHYKAYSNDINLANAEVDARRFKRGLWQDSNPIAPWDYRKNKRQANTSNVSIPQTTLPAGASKRQVFLCNSTGSAVYHTDKTCHVLKRCKSDIITVTEAQAIREYNRRADKTCAK